MKNSVKKNYIYNLLYQILIIILPVMTTPYLSRVLGAESIGIYSYVLSVTTYFILFGTVGINLYGQKEIAFYQNDKEKYSKKFKELFWLKAFTTLISLIIFYFSFVWKQNQYNLYYKILLLEIFSNLLDISWFFQGLEEFKKTVLRNLFVKLISVFCIFIFVKGRDDLHIYFIIYVASLFIGNLSLWMYLPKYICKVNINIIDMMKNLKPTLSFFIPQLAIQLYTVFDRTMIGIIVSDKSEVGYYTQAEKIIKLVLTLITSFSTVMLPRIASTFSQGDNGRINEYLKKSVNLLFILAFPLILGVCAVSNDFVPLFFGEGYEKVIPIMKVLSPLILIIGMGSTIGVQYLLSTNHQKEYTIAVSVGAVVNMICNFYLIRKFGAFGAALATVIAETIVTFVQIFFAKRIFNFENIFKYMIQYIFAAIIMYIGCLLVKMIQTDKRVTICLQISIGACIYFISLLIMKNKFLYGYINEIKKKNCHLCK